MNDDMNATMAEALRLTREGRLMEATALLQQGLGGAAQPAPARPLPSGILRGRQKAHPSGLPRAGGLLDRLPARLSAELPVGLPGNSPLVQPGLVLPGSVRVAAPLPRAHPAARSGTSPTPRLPGRVRTTSTCLPVTPASRYRSSSCCTVAPRTPRTSQLAPG